MITEPLIRTEAELSLVLHCLQLQRTEAAHLAQHVSTEANRDMYGDQVAEIDRLMYAIRDRKAKANNFNPMDGDRVEIDPCTGHGKSW